MFVSKRFIRFGLFKLNVINERPSIYTYLIKFCKLCHGRLSHVHSNKVKHMSNMRLIKKSYEFKQQQKHYIQQMQSHTHIIQKYAKITKLSKPN